jgi:hypothetical protein
MPTPVGADVGRGKDTLRLSIMLPSANDDGKTGLPTAAVTQIHEQTIRQLVTNVELFLAQWDAMVERANLITEELAAGTTPYLAAPTPTDDPPAPTAPPTPSTPPTATSPPNTPPTPAKILVRWRDIVEALPLRETMPRSAYEERRRRLAYLNQRYSGPIQTGGKGGQPRVDLAELLDWWNALTSQVQHAIDRERDTAATLLDQHNYGRTGRVAPGIVGSIKARRQREGR